MKKQFRKVGISFKYRNKNSDFDGLELNINFDGSTLEDDNTSNQQLSYDEPDLIEEDTNDE